MYDSFDVAMNIKMYANKKGIHLQDLLKDCGLGKNAFSNMAKGNSLASDSLARIADYLDVSVDYLLGRTDKPEVNK